MPPTHSAPATCNILLQALNELPVTVISSIKIIDLFLNLSILHAMIES